ncbi:DNA binding domain, excisionase family, partial [Dysosmobacter welbionis]
RCWTARRRSCPGECPSARRPSVSAPCPGPGRCRRHRQRCGACRPPPPGGTGRCPGCPRPRRRSSWRKPG